MPQEAWSSKRERQYKKIKQGQRQEGHDQGAAGTSAVTLKGDTKR